MDNFMTTEHKLTPLEYGNILIVGVKASNLSDDLRNHPRIITWDSQTQGWERRDLPDNVRAVFMTRFIGHAAFDKIVKEARKKRITIFNPLGTGMISKQVKELLNMVPKEPETEPAPEDHDEHKYEEKEKETEDMVKKAKVGGRAKLNVLHSFIDFNLGNTENAHILLKKAEEKGIETTLQSLAQMVSTLRRKKSGKTPTLRAKREASESIDVTIQMFDEIIRNLKDMRQYLVETVAENKKLKMKLDKFKRFFED